MMGKSSVIPERLRIPGDLVGRVFLLLITLLIGLSVFSCAKHPPRNLLNGAHTGPMTATISASVDSTGNSQPVVVVSLNRSALVFKRHNSQIEAGLTVSVSAFSDQELVGGGVATQLVTIDKWDAAASDSVITVHVPLQVSSDGETVLEVRARSLHSSRFWNHRLSYDAGLWHKVPFSLLKFSWDASAGEMVFQPQELLQVELLVEARGGSTSEDQWWVALAISSQNGTNTWYQKQTVRPSETEFPLRLSFTLDTVNLPFGDVTVSPLLWTSPEGSKSSSPWQDDHLLTNLHINFDDNDDWDDQLEWLEGKAPESALQILSTGPGYERSKRWVSFWHNQSVLNAPSGQEHGPVDHLLLIVEADRRFSRSKPGSYSARGMALIRYGIPDEIDKVGDSTRRDERWETWIYQPSHLKLIFHDPHGLGDFMFVEEVLPSLESK